MNVTLFKVFYEVVLSVQYIPHRIFHLAKVINARLVCICLLEMNVTICLDDSLLPLCNIRREHVLNISRREVNYFWVLRCAN